MSRKRFINSFILAIAFMVLFTGCGEASEPVNSTAYNDENGSESTDIADTEKEEETKETEETERESMQDAQEDMIAEAIKQETA